MNREEKRKLTKNLRKKGKTQAEIDQIVEMKKMIGTPGDLSNGETVRLNIEKIKSHPGWDKMRDTYKSFVENNTDTEFTVEYVDKYPKHQIVCLTEDTSIPKWYFWSGDLSPLAR